MLICEFCKIYESDDKPNFSKHIKNCFANPNSLNSMKTKWDCSICDKFFVKKLEFTAHKKEHQIEKECICPFCGLKEENKDVYFVPYHIDYCKDNPEKKEPLLCSICNSYETIYPNSLSQHENLCKLNKDKENVSDVVTQWLCIICEKYFPSRRIRAQHNKKSNHTRKDFNKVVHSKGMIPEQVKQIFSCSFCEWRRSTTKAGIKLHEKYCPENPNRAYSKRHTPDSRKKLSNIMKERHAKNIAARWKNPHVATSYPEKFFMKVIKNEFEDKNYTKELPIGKWFFDFAWKDKKRAIEIDGQQHQRYKHQIESDKKKDAYAKSQGWKVLRISWKDIYNNPKKFIKIAKRFIDY